MNKSKSNVWVSPKLVRIGNIADVSGTVTGLTQCANSNPTCPTLNKS